MNKILILSLLLVLNLFAQQSKQLSANYSLSFETGQRVDNLDWNINQLNDNPNILLELTWDDVTSYYGKLELHGEEGPYRLKVSYSRSLDAHEGDNQDSDYASDNRQDEYSRSNNGAEDSYFEDFAISVGQSYDITSNSNLIFWLGYEQNKQYLKMNNGYQTIDTNTPSNVGSFANLNSTYDSTWKGFMDMVHWNT